jgi:hypothetical protein
VPRSGPRPARVLARRLAAPLVALAPLLLVHAIASSVIAASAAPDAVDTRARLARVYARLGIDRTPPAAPEEDDGCRCRPRPRSREAGARERVPVPNAARMPRAVAIVLVVIIALVMLVPLAFALRRSLRDAERRPAAVEEEERASPAAAAPAPWRADLEGCRRLVAEGRLAEAYAGLHRVTLLELERARLITLDPRTTNWEHVRRLSSRLELRELLSEVTTAAEESVLGARPPAPERYAALERLVLERLAPGPAREALR